MLKKTIRRLGALAMVLAMAVSVFAVNASATEVTGYPEKGTAVITKQITKEANVMAPNGTYTFEYAALADAPADGIALNGTITSAPAAGDVGKTVVDATGSVTITADATKFGKPGTYKYNITENASTYADGTAYGAITYLLEVTVARNEDDSLGIMALILNKENGKKSVYENPYSPAHETQKNYVFKKVVTGNQGDKNLEFPFTFGVTNSKDTAKEYYYVITKRDATKSSTGVIKQGETKTVNLMHDEYVTIYGVSETDTVSAQETDAQGYTSSEKTEVDRITGDTTKTVTNHKEIQTPTGVIMTIAPYALMVVLAGAFAVVFLTRRNRAE